MFPPKNYPPDSKCKSRSTLLKSTVIDGVGAYVQEPFPEEPTIDQSLDASMFSTESMIAAGVPLGSFNGSFTDASIEKKFIDVQRATAFVAQELAKTPQAHD